MPEPYFEPDAHFVGEALRAGAPAEFLVDPSWTPKQRKTWVKRFDAHARFLIEREKRERPEREAFEAEVAEARKVRAGDRDLVAGASAAVQDAAAAVAGATVDRLLPGADLPPEATGGGVADWINRRTDRREDVYAEATRRDGRSEFGFSVLRGTTRSLATGVPLAATGVGAPGVIAGFAAIRGSRARTEGIDAGLRGRELDRYVGRAAAIEGGVAGAFQLVGAGGFEKLLVGGVLRNKEGLKQLLAHTAFELTEENVTEVADAYNQAASGITGPVTTEQLWELFQQTTAQTLLVMGATGAGQAARAGKKREAMVRGLAARYEWSTEQADAVLRTAAKRKGDFEANLARAIEAEEALDPLELARWAIENPEAARELASMETPGRKAWDKSGLPRPPSDKAGRARAARHLREILAEFDEPQLPAPVAEDPGDAAPQLTEEQLAEADEFVKRVMAEEAALEQPSPITEEELRARVLARLGGEARPPGEAQVPAGEAPVAPGTSGARFVAPPPEPGTERNPVYGIGFTPGGTGPVRTRPPEAQVAPTEAPPPPPGVPDAPPGGWPDRRDSVAGARTGQQFHSTFLRGEGRPESPYNPLGAQVPILGPGTYSTPSRAHAQTFGPNVSSVQVRLENPLVVESDQQWRALTRSAGWEFPNPFGLSPKRTEKLIGQLRSKIEDMGHDGVVVRVPEDEATGKTLQTVFGASQAVSFEAKKEKIKGPKPDKASAPAGEARPVATKPPKMLKKVRKPKKPSPAPAAETAPKQKGKKPNEKKQERLKADRRKKREARKKRREKGFKRNLSEEERTQLEELKKKIRGKMGRLSVGVDPTLVVDGVRLTSLYVKAGIRNFREYVEEALESLGPESRGYLLGWWQTTAEQSEHGEDMEDVTRRQANEIIAEVEADLAEDEVPSFEASAREIVLSEESAQAKNRAMKALAKEHGITEKAAQERVESVLVEIGREIATDEGRSTKERFDALVELYENQPNFSADTTSSKAAQAFSTPLPLAYAASVMAEVHQDVTLYEPTAGMGALTLAADPAKTSVNETWDPRRAELAGKGYRSVTGENAETWAPDETFDRVLANPPFGKPETKPVNKDGFLLKQREHLIAARALDAMEDDGFAALILGSKLHGGSRAFGGAEQLFFNYLESRYFVAGNYEVNGDLYGKQGTKFPVRLVVLAGRRPTPLSKQELEPAEPGERLETWQAVWSKIEEVQSEAARLRAGLGPAGAGGPLDGGPRGVAGANDAGEGPGAASPNGPEAGGGGSRGAGPGGRGRPGRGGRGAGGEPAGAGGVRAGGSAVVEGAGDAGSPPGERGVRGPRGVEEQAGEGDGDASAGGQEQGRGGRDPGADAPDVGRKRAVTVKPGKPVNDRQREYSGLSRAGPLGTIVNNMLADSMAEALTELSASVGDVDAYVAGKLGLKVEELLDGRLGQEQVDGVGLAIHNLERGRSLVIGDQTGIGKGRQAAALIAYAQRQGYMPVFLTANPKLFSDMYSDVKDVGKTVNPFVIGNKARSTIKDLKNGEVILEGLSSAKQAAIMAGHMSRETSLLEAGYDAIFLPYSQLKDLPRKPGGSLGGGYELNDRHQLLLDLARNDKVLFVMDESHKAAGSTSVTGNFMRGGSVKRKVNDLTVEIPLPGVLHEVGVKGVVYLSATYAKRPETMPLYFKTALGIATDNATALMNAFEKGGVALQQWAANALSLGGEMIRRERDFAGVRFETKSVAASPAAKAQAVESMDKVAVALRAITEYSTVASEIIKDLGEQATAQTESRLSVANFSSVIHNYVAQVLLASKVQATVDEAIASHKRGEATVIALSNTMESFLKTFAKDNELESGDEVNMNFADVLERALNRTMRSKITDAGGLEEVTQYTPEQLGLLDQYEEALELIQEVTDSALPASPIDAIHARLREAGLRTDEITGRHHVLDREGESWILRKRSADEIADKNRVVNGFNTGELDVVILNASGAEGISLHASVKNPPAGQRPRHMIVAQADLNIDTVKQTLGRILRTGMVRPAKEVARYTLLSLPVEAERRPFAVLAAKLASLNANTTADADDDVKVGSLDFINKYGDRVVSEVLSEDTELSRLLGLSPNVSTSGEVSTLPGAARTATGRMAILPNQQQAEFYELVTRRYQELIEELKEANEYDLEVEVQEEWNAKLEESMSLEDATDPNQPFTSGLALGRWTIKDPRRPMKPDDVKRAMVKQFDTEDPSKHEEIAREQVADYYRKLEALEREYVGVRPADPGVEEGQEADDFRRRLRAYEERANRVETSQVTVRGELDELASMAGQGLILTTRSGEGADAVSYDYSGVLVGLKLTVPKTGNPWRPNLARAVVAVEHPRRTVTFALSRLVRGTVSLRRRSAMGGTYKVEEFGRNVDPDATTTRHVFTGNLIKALDTSGRGQITTFRTSDGEAVTGLVMPQGWRMKDAKNDPRMAIRTGAAAVELLKASDRASIKGKDSDGKDTAKLVVSRSGWSYMLSVSRAKSKGGPVFLNRGLFRILGDWHSSGRTMKVLADESSLEQAVDHLLGMGYTFTADKSDAGEVARAHGREADLRLDAPARAAAGAPPSQKIKGRRVPSKGGIQKVEVVNKIKELWPDLSVRGAATFRKKLKARGSAGWFVPGLGEIRTLEDWDVVTHLHELGHFFDRELGDWTQDRARTSAIKKELIRLGRDLYGSRRPEGGYKREGFAEFIREYLLGSGDLQDRAPRLYDWFTTDYLPANPKEAGKLAQLQEQVALLNTQAPQQAIEAFMRPTRRDWSAGRIAAALARFEAAWIDSAMPLLRGMKRTGADLSQIAPQHHPYMLAIYYARSAGGRAKFAALSNTVNLVGEANGKGLRDVLAPILEQGEQVFKEWKEYMVAKRALVRYHANGINPGISREVARTLVRERESRPGFAQAEKEFTDFAHRALEPLVESGRMTQEEFEAIKGWNPVYVPFLRQVESEGTGTTAQSRGVDRVRGGGDLPIHDPVDAMIQQYERIQQTAMQHDVLRALVRFYEQHKGSGQVAFLDERHRGGSARTEVSGKAPFLGKLMSEIPAPQEAVSFSADQVRKQVLKAAKDRGGDASLDAVEDALEDFWDDQLTVFRTGTEYKGREKVVSFVLNGKRRFFQVEADLMPILEGVTQSAFLPGGLGALVRGATQLQRLGATGLNPTFGMVRNTLRDTLTAAITADYHSHVPVFSTAHGSVLDLMDSEWAQRYHAAGLDISGRIGQDLKEARRLSNALRKRGPVEEAARSLLPPGIRDVQFSAKLSVSALQDNVSGLRDLLSHSEVGPRLMEFRGAFVAGQEQWGNDQDALILAGLAAKDVTVNFSRAGHAGRRLNEIVLFFNASVQSADRLLRAAGAREALPWAKHQERQANAARTLRRGATYLTSVAVLLWLLNRDDEDWKELPPHEKWGYLHLRLGDTWIRTPLPFEAGSVFGALPVAVLEEQRSPGALREALGVALKGASPLELEPGVGLLRNVALLGPLADVIANEDWKGAPIVPSSLEQNRVPADQYGPRTLGLSRLIGAHVPGGGMSPAKVEHVLNGYTGGLYRRTLAALETALDPSGIRPLEDPSTLPVLGTLFVRPGTSRLTHDFYDRLAWLRQRRGSEIATVEELAELALAERTGRELQDVWRVRREALGSARAAGDVQREATTLLQEAQDRVRAHKKLLASEEGRRAGLGAVIYQLTDPSGEPDPALLEGVSAEEAHAALRAEVRRRGGGLMPRLSSGRLSSFGERQARLRRLLR